MPNEATPIVTVEKPATESSGKSETPKLPDVAPSILGDDKATAKGSSSSAPTVVSIADDVDEDDEDDEDDDDETVIDALSKEVDKLKKKVFERKAKRTKKRRTIPKPKARAWTLFG